MDARTLEPTSVLVVDDDAAVAVVLVGLLTQAEMEARQVGSGAEALASLAARPVDVVIADLRMPGMDGLELLGRIKEQWPETAVVMLTAHGTVSTAVEAMKRGAADFVQKPFDRDELLFVVRKAAATARHAESRAPRLPPALAGHAMLGTSRAMRECDELLTRAARSQASVLLRGESGTGKELAARAVHERSTRHAGPFVAVHAAALPETLLESELFGHEKGAFTGAVARKPGRVELAAGGTLFLDELGDVPMPIQIKLLRVIQERELERLGGTHPIPVDVRLVAATHRDLEAMVAAGTFREDLLFRLDVITIRLPPLRERPGDVEELATELCRRLGAANGRPEATLTEDALTLLAQQPWPGNVRQLQNFVERLVVMSESPTIDAAITGRELARQAPTGLPTVAASPANGAASASPPTLPEQRREAEKAALLDALRRSRDNRTVAARMLGVGRRTLYNKLREFGVE